MFGMRPNYKKDARRQWSMSDISFSFRPKNYVYTYDKKYKILNVVPKSSHWDIIIM